MPSRQHEADFPKASHNAVMLLTVSRLRTLEKKHFPPWEEEGAFARAPGHGFSGGPAGGKLLQLHPHVFECVRRDNLRPTHN